MDYSMPDKVITLEPSTLETIDTGIYRWVDETLNLSTTTNTGFEKTPVLWLGTERAYQIKSNKELRDSAGKLKLPLITVNRDSFSKNPDFKGIFQAHLPEKNDFKGGSITLTKRIQQEKTRNFANSYKRRVLKNGDETGRIDNSEIVYESLTSPIPTYVTCMYSITIRTEYQQQMNDLVTPFITRTGQINNFLFEQDGHRYEAFIEQEFSENKNTTNLGEEERMFETKIQIKVLGHLMGEGVNREKPKITIRENVVKVRISRERVIVGDKIPWKKKNNDYID